MISIFNNQYVVCDWNVLTKRTLLKTTGEFISKH